MVETAVGVTYNRGVELRNRPTGNTSVVAAYLIETSDS